MHSIFYICANFLCMRREYKGVHEIGRVLCCAVAKKRALLTLPSALIPEKPGVIQHPRTVLILSGLLGCGTHCHGYFRAAARKWISRCPSQTIIPLTAKSFLVPICYQRSRLRFSISDNNITNDPRFVLYNYSSRTRWDCGKW